MKSLREELNVSNHIYQIKAKNIEEAIIKAFKGEKYNFYLNSELIDVNNRFRIFSFNGVNYIIKKSSLKSGFEEEQLAKKAYDKLNNIEISSYRLNVILPILKIINNDSYIVTEYKGTSLQECLYSNILKNSLTINDIKELLEKFLEIGILYRGFLPRNTIVNDKIIYLLDWEDVVFCDEENLKIINKFWETNFLLNWSYFYSFDDLNYILEKYKGNKSSEPSLIKYEKNFESWIGTELEEISLRDEIMKTVFFAEQKLNLSSNEFCIVPNDMAHLVSDIFNSDIDVLFDISSYVIRKYDEVKYYQLLKILSQLIVYLYKNKYNIKIYSIIIILIMLELASTKCISDIEIDSYIEVLNIDKFKNNNLIMCFYEKKNFEIELEKVVDKVIKNFNGKNVDKLNVKRLSDYMLNL